MTFSILEGRDQPAIILLEQYFFAVIVTNLVAISAAVEAEARQKMAEAKKGNDNAAKEKQATELIPAVVSAKPVIETRAKVAEVFNTNPPEIWRFFFLSKAQTRARQRLAGLRAGKPGETGRH